MDPPRLAGVRELGMLRQAWTAGAEPQSTHSTREQFCPEQMAAPTADLEREARVLSRLAFTPQGSLPDQLGPPSESVSYSGRNRQLGLTLFCLVLFFFYFSVSRILEFSSDTVILEGKSQKKRMGLIPTTLLG